MILGFVFQLTALHFGDLALVQPILAAELLFVFGYLGVAGSRRVRRRDWLAVAAMSAGLDLFLRLASPSGGRLHAPGSSWLLAGLATAGVVLAALDVAWFTPSSSIPGSSRGPGANVLLFAARPAPGEAGNPAANGGPSAAEQYSQAERGRSRSAPGRSARQPQCPSPGRQRIYRRIRIVTR